MGNHLSDVQRLLIQTSWFKPGQYYDEIAQETAIQLITSSEMQNPNYGVCFQISWVKRLKKAIFERLWNGKQVFCPNSLLQQRQHYRNLLYQRHQTLLPSPVERYSGNPLALKIVASAIQELFEGSLTEFLKYKTFVIDEIRFLFDQQVNRLLELEK